MTIRVSVIGYDLLGKRIADAVAQQPDMDLAGVFDDDPSCQSMVMHRGYSLLPGPPDQLVPPGDVAVLCRTDGYVVDTPVIYAAYVRSSTGQLFTPLSRAADVAGQSCVRVALPDVIALGRILQAIDSLASVERLFASIIVRSGHATERSAGSVDALEPLPEDAHMTRQMTEAFGPRVPCFRITRVRAPYSHSHLHTVKLDLDKQLDRQLMLDALAREPRILIGSAADGFATTADIQEFFRNGSRPRGDRPEVFVWEESIMVKGQSLCLMMDVCQEATSVLDTIDALRLRQGRALDGGAARRQTDASLQVGQRWQASV